MTASARAAFAGGFCLFVAATACSSALSPSGGPDAGYCESSGYSSPVGGACAKGTCMASGTSSPCCGSLCPTCESKGLVSFDAGGMCPSGLCPSADVTATLVCCDTCGPLNADASSDGPVESGHPEASSRGDASDATSD
jgi:hypothetical protein